jgi:hypothetical protein
VAPTWSSRAIHGKGWRPRPAEAGAEDREELGEGPALRAEDHGGAEETGADPALLGEESLGFPMAANAREEGVPIGGGLVDPGTHPG